MGSRGTNTIPIWTRTILLALRRDRATQDECPKWKKWYVTLAIDKFLERSIRPVKTSTYKDIDSECIEYRVARIGLNNIFFVKGGWKRGFKAHLLEE